MMFLLIATNDGGGDCDVPVMFLVIATDDDEW